MNSRSEMFPTKNMTDYMMEINRLFPRTTENELQSPLTTFNTNYMTQSPFSATMVNHSSSSADSTSPESFPDMSRHQFRQRYTTVSDSTLSDTPSPMRRQRPIVGRKIMNPEHGLFQMRSPFDQISGVSPIKVVPKDSDMRSFWHQDIPMSHQTPQKLNKMQNQHVYELFPSENRGFEFRTPDKNISSPQTSRFSSANISPTSTMSMSPVSPLPRRFMTPPPQFKRNFLSPAPLRIAEDAGRVCTFCRKNGETPLVYMTHTVKERIGNRHIVTCPILRSHVCSTCQATGDDAHTITYCPVLRSNNNGLPLQSTTITLKNTRVKSNGRKRY